jgi:hypothetical protein
MKTKRFVFVILFYDSRIELPSIHTNRLGWQSPTSIGGRRLDALRFAKKKRAA